MFLQFSISQPLVVTNLWYSWNFAIILGTKFSNLLNSSQVYSVKLHFPATYNTIALHNASY